MKRNLLKSVCVVLLLAVIMVGCGGQHVVSQPVSVELEPVGNKTDIQRLIEGVNHYLFAVFTHTMSLHKRRCLEVTPGVVKEASYSIVAILNANIRDFRITKCEITKTNGKIDYEATFFIGQRKVENYPTTFYFQLLGGPGDPVHTVGEK